MILRFVSAEEIGVVDEEALIVVVSIHKPSVNSIGVAASGFAGIWMELVRCIDLDPVLVVLCFKDVDILFAIVKKRFPTPVSL